MMKKFRYLYMIAIIIFMLFPSIVSKADEIEEMEETREPIVVIKDINREFKERSKTAIEKFTEQDEISVIEEDIQDVTYADFIENLNEVRYVYYDKTAKFFYIEYKNGDFGVSRNPDYAEFQKDLLENGVDVKSFSLIKLVNDTGSKKIDKNEMFGFFNFFFMIFLSLLLSWFLLRGMYGKEFMKKFKIGRTKEYVVNTDINTNVNTKSIQKEENTNVKRFSDIAGLREVKKDMESLVDFLKYKEKYIEAGAKLPKGVILYGPPGTGKTLLAKAVAGEAGIPFLYMSGSDFIEMYVGVGAKRVRELFEKAKKQAPCIIFIDEIDTIGGKRGNENNSEDRKTINELLTQMDGFKETENILVIAATNRLEDLDSALLRPGRFTNKFCVPLPQTAKERMEVIKIYTKNKKVSEDVDFDNLAKETIGFSPAKIEALLNEAAIISVQKRKNYINKEILDEAMFKMLLSGHIKENQKDRDKNELEVVAWHEAGHALIGKLNGKEIPKVTILSSTSGAGGVTFTTPNKTHLLSVEDLKNEVKELYGGRCAESIFYGNDNKVTTGASNDIDRATDIIKEIVTTYGMTESFGLLNLSKLGIDNKIIIEKEIELSKELQEETQNMLKQNYEKLKKIALMLLENETVYENELDEVIKEDIDEKE